MAEERVQRKLAAILAADVVGYSRLIGEDEVGTRRRFNDLLDIVVNPTIDQHRGRLVKTMGDGFLAEFPSVVEAVQCAADVQTAITLHQADEPETSKMLLRIGIHLGDVIVEGDDIHGDGVNIAARLEELSESGGICISDMVRVGVGNRVALELTDLGDQSLKNIAEPVRVYRVELEDKAISGGTLSESLFRRPAVAVLPFENLSGDPDQEYFADGLTEDIITALSLWRQFPVIARNSSFAYKGQSPDIRKVGEELDARYVIEGSVRKSSNRIRVTAQLINAETGHHVWAERYDRNLEDIFDLQDEITQRIASTVAPELERIEVQRLADKIPQNLDAWDFCQQGMAHAYNNEFAEEGISQARTMFEKAIEIDPNYSRAYTGVAWSHVWTLTFGYADDRQKVAANAISAARRAVSLDQSDSLAHTWLGVALLWNGEHNLAIPELEKALSLNPSNFGAYVTMGNALTLVGKPDEGIPFLDTAVRLNPQNFRNTIYYSFMSRAHLTAKRYEEAADWARKAIPWNPNAPLPHLLLAASLGHLGQGEEARKELATCDEIRPGYISDTKYQQPYKNITDDEHFLDGLRKAGWEG